MKIIKTIILKNQFVINKEVPNSPKDNSFQRDQRKSDKDKKNQTK